MKPTMYAFIVPRAHDYQKIKVTCVLSCHVEPNSWRSALYIVGADLKVHR
jgi:hypothetical protein